MLQNQAARVPWLAVGTPRDVWESPFAVRLVVVLLGVQGIAVGTKTTGQELEDMGFLVLLVAIVVEAGVVVVAVATAKRTAIAGAVVGNRGEP